MVRKSVAVCDKKGALGSGYIPKTYQTTCSANSEGLFAYYQYAEAGMILTCRTQDGRGSGWAGITGVKDLSLIDPVKHQRDRRRQGGQEPEAARARARALHRDPRVASRGAVPLADDRHLQRARRRDRPALLPDRHGEGHVEARTESVQRSRHDQERHRQPDPAPDADHARRHRRQAGDLGRKGRAEESLLRRAVRGAREEGPDAAPRRT